MACFWNVAAQKSHSGSKSAAIFWAQVGSVKSVGSQAKPGLAEACMGSTISRVCVCVCVCA